MRQDDSFKGLDNIVDLSVKLVKTKRHKGYDMIYELLKLVFASTWGNDKCWKGIFCNGFSENKVKK